MKERYVSLETYRSFCRFTERKRTEISESVQMTSF